MPENDDTGIRMTFIQAAIYFFDLMCAEDPEITPENRTQVSLSHYAPWLQERLNLTGDDAVVELCARLDMTADDWALFRQAVDIGAGAFHRVWPTIVLSGMPVPKHPLRSVHFLCLFEWADGALIPLSAYLGREMCDGALREGILATTMAEVVRGYVAMLSTQGLDAMHDMQSAQYGAAAIQRAIDDVDAMPKRLPPDATDLDRVVAAALSRLLGNVLRPARMLEQAKAKASLLLSSDLPGPFAPGSPPPPPEPPGPTGGWDT